MYNQTIHIYYFITLYLATFTIYVYIIYFHKISKLFILLHHCFILQYKYVNKYIHISINIYFDMCKKEVIFMNKKVSKSTALIIIVFVVIFFLCSLSGSISVSLAVACLCAFPVSLAIFIIKTLKKTKK